MCCTPLGREDRYLSELRFAFFAALFFKKVYPYGRVFVATTLDANVPDMFSDHFETIRYNFSADSFATERQLFYRDFCQSDKFTSDTVFTGCDVLVLNSFPKDTDGHHIHMTYRNHPSQPYCSDLVLVETGVRNQAISFLEEVVNTMKWLPKENRPWTDQIALCLTIGKLSNQDYDGESHHGTRFRDVALHPADRWLYTPNDYFSSQLSHNPGSMVIADEMKLDFDKLRRDKITIHFKGNRKSQFFNIARQAFESGYINLQVDSLPMPREHLFNEQQ
jgi:hypothetical protein